MGAPELCQVEVLVSEYRLELSQDFTGILYLYYSLSHSLLVPCFFPQTLCLCLKCTLSLSLCLSGSFTVHDATKLCNYIEFIFQQD